MNTNDLTASISVLECLQKDGFSELKYIIEYKPKDPSVYMSDIKNSSELFKNYAFKIETQYSFTDVISALIRVMDESIKEDCRLDVLFGNIETSRLSTESRYESTGRIIIMQNSISYNRELNESERLILFNELRKKYERNY